MPASGCGRARCRRRSQAGTRSSRTGSSRTTIPILQLSTYTNLGTVHKYGVDGSIAYQVVPQLSLYAFGSYLHSKILDDVQIGTCGATGFNTIVGPNAERVHRSARRSSATRPASANPARRPIPSAAAPRAMSARVLSWASRPSAPARATSTTRTRRCTSSYTPAAVGGVEQAPVFYQVYGRKHETAYTTVDLDARVSLKPLRLQRSHLAAVQRHQPVRQVLRRRLVDQRTPRRRTPPSTSGRSSAPRTISGTVQHRLLIATIRTG